MANVRLLACVVLVACSTPSEFANATYDAAQLTATEVTLSRRIDELAADSMLGRGPGQRGDTLAVAYLERQMRAIGLEPGGNYGFQQPVALTRLRATGRALFRVNGKIVALDSSLLIFAAAKSGEHAVQNAPVVFVGHGVVAPEYGWDDYGQIDLHGKIALILDGEPEAVSAKRFGTRGEKGPYGFRFLKGRNAMRHGAAGVVIIRTGGDSVHRTRRHRLQDEAIVGDAPGAIAESPVTIHVAASTGETLARAAGTTLAAWRALAEDSAFGPRETSLRLDASMRSDSINFTSHNVVGIVRGSDVKLRDECVVYLGHWDAYGIGPAVRGDSIYNGALDDAAGVSQMLLIAQTVRALPRAPRRTMVFVATTAEERGMRGANAYAAQPVCALSRTALAIGMDWAWTWGITDTIGSNGIGYSTVDSLAGDVATRLGKAFVPGVGEYWLASDHAVLALRGVPAWFGGLDGEVRGKPRGWAEEQLAQQETHVPYDERKSAWNLSGALFEARFLFEVGTRAAEQSAPFVWTVDSEFKRAATTLSKASVP